MAETFDVVVVGFGLAGAIAAIEAHDRGASVLIVEKQTVPGGISICAGGGARIADDADQATAYLKASSADTTPEPVLRALAQGVVELPRYVKNLAEPLGATISAVPGKGNYPLPGYETWSYIEVDSIPGLNPAAAYPHVRAEGAAKGITMFALAHRHVMRRGIEVRLGTAVERLWRDAGEIKGVSCGNALIAARRAVVLACGGFEAAEDLQRQFWPAPMRSAATLANTGDGIRMAQAAGAGLWHMWHSHGVYGFHHPDPSYKFGIRIRRLRNWTPGSPANRASPMSWIVVDRRGRRFMNEYDPYMQDTNHRPLSHYDPATQSFPRVPAVLLVDAKGRALYTLCEPSYNDAAIAARFNKQSLEQLDALVLTTRSSLAELADAFELDREAFAATIDDWNAACAAGIDRAFGRPPTSMMPIAEPPFSAAHVWPVVSNTQGGLPHDEEQRVLDAFGAPIPRLYVAGELGSVFGHLYISGGNYSECLVGGWIAGRNAARLAPWLADLSGHVASRQNRRSGRQ
jgi:succinate dehydrogenase/fumarate reductase flavoprotein subunit